MSLIEIQKDAHDAMFNFQAVTLADFIFQGTPLGILKIRRQTSPRQA
jgi:hypothetical protein